MTTEDLTKRLRVRLLTRQAAPFYEHHGFRRLRDVNIDELHEVILVRRSP